MTELSEEAKELAALIETIKIEIETSVQNARMNEQGRREVFSELDPNFVHSEVAGSQYNSHLLVDNSSTGGLTLTHFAAGQENYGVIGSPRRDEPVKTPVVHRAILSVAHTPRSYDRHVMLYMPEGAVAQVIFMTGTNIYDPSIHSSSRLNPPVNPGSRGRAANLTDLRFFQQVLGARI